MSSYPTAEEYCRWGLSAKVVRHAYTTLPAAVAPLVGSLIDPLAAPGGRTALACARRA
jgi:hypothetical protein